jgi:hypothetical protein
VFNLMGILQHLMQHAIDSLLKHEVLRHKKPTVYRVIGLGLEHVNNKKGGPPSPRAGVGQENIATVHEPEPTQTERSP